MMLSVCLSDINILVNLCVKVVEFTLQSDPPVLGSVLFGVITVNLHPPKIMTVIPPHLIFNTEGIAKIQFGVNIAKDVAIDNTNGILLV